MTADQPHPVVDRPRRKNLRLRAMLALTALALGFYVFVHLDRSVVEQLGPVGEGIHDLFNQVPGKAAPLTPTARRFASDVKALGGDPGVGITKRGYFGTIGQTESFNVTIHNPEFNDAALARLAELHGGRITGLYLENTAVTDAGLKSLSKFTMLRHLIIHNFPPRIRPGAPEPPPRITDAGMAHLKGLTQLWTLNLSDQPITDAGLDAIKDLPELTGLYLSRTKVKGDPLARSNSLPRLHILYLDGSEMSEHGLSFLSRATSLEILSLDGVPLTAKALPLLGAIPRLRRLDITGCGFLDEEVDALIKSKAGLKVVRK